MEGSSVKRALGLFVTNIRRKFLNNAKCMCVIVMIYTIDFLSIICLLSDLNGVVTHVGALILKLWVLWFTIDDILFHCRYLPSKYSNFNKLHLKISPAKRWPM